MAALRSRSPTTRVLWLDRRRRARLRRKGMSWMSVQERAISVQAQATAQVVPFVGLARQHAALGEELRVAFERVVGADGFILGDEVEAFEREFASYCQVSECV